MGKTHLASPKEEAKSFPMIRRSFGRSNQVHRQNQTCGVCSVTRSATPLLPVAARPCGRLLWGWLGKVPPLPLNAVTAALRAVYLRPVAVENAKSQSAALRSKSPVGLGTECMRLASYSCFRRQQLDGSRKPTPLQAISYTACSTQGRNQRSFMYSVNSCPRLPRFCQTTTTRP